MAAPVNVSPLIRFCRWSLLTAGIVYGFDKRRQYRAEEAKFREEDEKGRPEREAYIAREKARINEETLAELEEIFLGTPRAKETESARSDKAHDKDVNISADNDIEPDDFVVLEPFAED